MRCIDIGIIFFIDIQTIINGNMPTALYIANKSYDKNTNFKKINVSNEIENPLKHFESKYKVINHAVEIFLQIPLVLI